MTEIEHKAYSILKIYSRFTDSKNYVERNLDQWFNSKVNICHFTELKLSRKFIDCRNVAEM